MPTGRKVSPGSLSSSKEIGGPPAWQLHLLCAVPREERDRRTAGAPAVPAVAVEDDGRTPRGPHLNGPATATAAGHSSCVRAPGVPRRPAHTLGSSLRPVATSRHKTNSTGDITPRSPPDRDFRRSHELFLP